MLGGALRLGAELVEQVLLARHIRQPLLVRLRLGAQRIILLLQLLDVAPARCSGHRGGPSM